MTYETVCLGNASILTFPRNGQMTEMLRVTDKGQVFFSYQQWDVNTATDLFFRALAVQSPELCKSVLPDLNAKLTTCEAERVDLSSSVAFWKNNNDRLIQTNENLSRTTSGSGALLWLAGGAIIGSLLTAWIMDRMKA